MQGVDFLQENKISVACFVGSGLNSNFHWLAHYRIVSRSWFKSFAEMLGSFTIENIKKLDIGFNISFLVIDISKK